MTDHVSLRWSDLDVERIKKLNLVPELEAILIAMVENQRVIRELVREALAALSHE